MIFHCYSIANTLPFTPVRLCNQMTPMWLPVLICITTMLCQAKFPANCRSEKGGRGPWDPDTLVGN